MKESLDLSLIEMNRWLKLEGREHWKWKTTKSRRRKKDSRNFLNGKTLLSFQMVLLLKLVCTQTEHHSLPSYFDGINHTKREIITGAAIFFVLDKLCVSFLIALRLPLYLLLYPRFCFCILR